MSSGQRYVTCPECGQERLSSPGGDLMGRHYRPDAELGENPYCPMSGRPFDHDANSYSYERGNQP